MNTYVETAVLYNCLLIDLSSDTSWAMPIFMIFSFLENSISCYLLGFACGYNVICQGSFNFFHHFQQWWMTTWVDSDLLKALVILSCATVSRSAVDPEDVKPYWKSEKSPHFCSWSTSLLFTSFSKTTNHRKKTGQ